MDFPYLAVLWDPRNTVHNHGADHLLAAVSRESWLPIIERDGFAVYTQPCRVPYLHAHPLGADSGVLLGILFSRGRTRQLSARELNADPRLANPDPESPHYLTHHYWGAYVALFSNHRGEWWVTRDCSGTIPCYYMTLFGFTLISSDTRNFLLFAAWADEQRSTVSFDVNWRYIVGFLAHSPIQIRETGIKNIYELMAGETLCNRGGCQSVEITWNPATFCETNSPDSLDTRTEALRDTAQRCIDAWASAHQWVVHSLSGGFDSSLVLALLNRSANRPNLVCVNRYSTGPGEDERCYARLAADAANAPLIEWPWDFGNHVLNESILTLPLGAKPSITALISSLEASFFTSLRAAHPLDAIWTGEGGDHLFLALKTTLPIGDFLRTRGLRRELLQVLSDNARLTGKSIPRLAFQTLRQYIWPTENDIQAPLLGYSLLAPSLQPKRNLPDFMQHPWYRATTHVSPGKRQQAIILADVLHRLRPIPGTQECIELQPLLSQPLIEQCLSIPTFELLHGGTTRGLARRAFAAEIPADIRNRELKGQTTHHALGLVRRSLPFLSELLLNGTLMKQGLLDRAALTPLLTNERPLNAQQLFALLACVAAETWLHVWAERSNAPHADPLRAPLGPHPTSL